MDELAAGLDKQSIVVDTKIKHIPGSTMRIGNLDVFLDITESAALPPP